MAWTKEILFVKETSSFVPLCLKNLPDKVMFYTQMKLKKIRLALRKKECFRKTTNLKVFCHCYVWWTFVGPT